MKSILFIILVTICPLLAFPQEKSNVPFPGAKHDYREGSCQLVGMPAKGITESHGCQACANNRHLERQSRAAEDKRIADIKVARYKAEQEAKIAEAKRLQAERSASASSERDKNRVYIGMPTTNPKPERKVNEESPLVASISKIREDLRLGYSYPTITEESIKSYPMGVKIIEIERDESVTGLERKSDDIVNNKGESLFKDKKIRIINYFYGDWFLITSLSLWGGYGYRTAYEGEFYNIKTKKIFKIDQTDRYENAPCVMIYLRFRKYPLFNYFDGHILNFGTDTECTNCNETVSKINDLIGHSDWKAAVMIWNSGKKYFLYLDNKGNFNKSATFVDRSLFIHNW